MEPLPDLGSLSDDDLKDLIERPRAARSGRSATERRLLHGKIDILRAELVARLQQRGRPERARPGRRRPADRHPHREGRRRRRESCTARSAASRTRRPRTTARGAARCCRRARRRPRRPSRSRPTRSASSIDDPCTGLEGPALVVRAGGGRAGESFRPAGERTRIGRSPDCEIFLDDVTVSRNHAVLVARRTASSPSRTRAR